MRPLDVKPKISTEYYLLEQTIMKAASQKIPLRIPMKTAANARQTRFRIYNMRKQVIRRYEELGQQEYEALYYAFRSLVFRADYNVLIISHKMLDDSNLALMAILDIDPNEIDKEAAESERKVMQKLEMQKEAAAQARAEAQAEAEVPAQVPAQAQALAEGIEGIEGIEVPAQVPAEGATGDYALLGLPGPDGEMPPEGMFRVKNQYGVVINKFPVKGSPRGGNKDDTET